MIDQLIKLVKQNADEAIVKNNALPNQFNNAAIEEVASQIFSGMQTQVKSGNMQQVTSMFKGGDMSALANHPMVAQIISNIAGNFASKFGVSQQTARTIAMGLIPQVISQFVNKTNDPNDKDFDLQDMLQSFTGNNGLNLNDVIGSVAGSSSQDGLGDLGNVLGNMLGKK
ncbi:MAG TPA: DUF937 domain-containing protein [Chryseolinea sp.]